VVKIAWAQRAPGSPSARRRQDEAAFEAPDQALVSVPRELVPAVRELIAKHRK
jgi:hypothetical protein